MKPFFRGTYWFLILFFISLIANRLFADDLSSQKGLLWQIDKPGLTPSYVFGTIHSEDARVNQLPPIVRSRFEQADSITLEMLMDIPTILTAASAMFFKGQQSLDQFIEQTFYEQIVEVLRQYQMPPMVVKRLKPWAVIATLSTPPTKTGEFLDLLLYKKAQQLEKPTYGLEKVEEQLEVFEGLSLEKQVILLKETLGRLDEMPGVFSKLHELYLKRDLTALMGFSAEYMRESSNNNKSLVDDFYKRMVDDRNLRMVKRMIKRLQEGNAFIAVGALHLPGDKGILRLLQAKGYQVSALY